MTDYWFKQGDTAPAIVAVLLDGNGNAVSLVGATARFHMMAQDGTVVVTANATVDPDQTNNKGQVSYSWGSLDLATEGVYLAEWEVTFLNGKKETFPNYDYDVVRVTREIA
jgi:hypothetical protein